METMEKEEKERIKQILKDEWGIVEVTRKEGLKALSNYVTNIHIPLKDLPLLKYFFVEKIREEYEEVPYRENMSCWYIDDDEDELVINIDIDY